MTTVRDLGVQELTCTRCGLFAGPPALPTGTRSFDPRAVATVTIGEDKRLVMVLHWQGCPELARRVEQLPQRPATEIP